MPLDPHTSRRKHLLPVPTEEPDALAIRERYRIEREKRLAVDRTDISHMTGQLAAYLEDPYAPVTERAAVNDDVDAMVVGGGFGGLMAAARLKEAGLTRVRIVDRAGDVGGVWYWNRYPGIMCDVESYIYLPLLEETGYIPQNKYASGAEIYEYSKLIARRYELYSLGLFQTSVLSMAWDEASARWQVRTDRGDVFTAKYVVVCTGTFDNPKLPGIPGLQDFQGRAFHTSRWDYQYTGGDSTGGLTGLADKRVGVVGTAATAVQVVPQVARHAKHTFVFQRTPSTVAPRNNMPTPADFAATLRPGWQKRRMLNFTQLVSGVAQPEDMVSDGWTEIYGPLRKPITTFGQTWEVAFAERGRLDLAKMQAIRCRIDEVVHDKETALRLKPWYPYNCKRPTFHDEYLETFNSAAVTLVDTDGRGIDRITPSGVVVGGRMIELDCLIFATGFDFESCIADKGFTVHGRGGRSLSDKWKNGLATLHGFASRGFPNLFIMPGANTQSALTVNFSHLLQENAAHFAYIVRELERRGARCFDVSAEAEAEWVARIVAGADRRLLEACTPGRSTNEGRLDDRPLANSNFAGTAIEFFGLLAAWRDEGTLQGLEIEQGVLFEASQMACDAEAEKL